MQIGLTTHEMAGTIISNYFGSVYHSGGFGMLYSLRQMGWGEYEVRAYAALLRCEPATGYRVAREAEIPTAKIYETLNRLRSRGAVRVVTASEGPVTYTALQPGALLMRVQQEQELILRTLRSELAAISCAKLQSASWLDWEQRKQRTLLQADGLRLAHYSEGDMH